MDRTTTQETHPWRATVRTVFQALIALSASWAVIVETIGLDPGLVWVSGSLAAAAAVTRVMALRRWRRSSSGSCRGCRPTLIRR